MIDNLYKTIKNGKLGRNIGISTGSPKLDSVIYGIQKGFIYTVGADTGGGKTSFALDVFIYNIFKNAGDVPVEILFYSFEMSADALFAKLLSRYIWDKHKQIITYKDILSLTTILSDEHERLINLARKWLENIAAHIVIYDKSLTPQGIYATSKEWLKKHGDFIEVSEHKEIYKPHNPRTYKLIVTDHVGLIGGTGSKKERIDLVVHFMIYFRNKCGITGVFIQQLNRNAKGMDRKLNGYELIQLDDFKDTSGTTDGSEVVIALYFPYREKIARCEGYPIQNVLKKKFRLVQVLKNRYGVPDVNIGSSFYGEISMFRDLPRPDEIGDYAPYLDLMYEDNKEKISTEKFTL